MHLDTKIIQYWGKAFEKIGVSTKEFGNPFFSLDQNYDSFTFVAKKQYTPKTSVAVHLECKLDKIHSTEEKSIYTKMKKQIARGKTSLSDYIKLQAKETKSTAKNITYEIKVCWEKANPAGDWLRISLDKNGITRTVYTPNNMVNKTFTKKLSEGEGYERAIDFAAEYFAHQGRWLSGEFTKSGHGKTVKQAEDKMPPYVRGGRVCHR